MYTTAVFPLKELHQILISEAVDHFCSTKLRMTKEERILNQQSSGIKKKTCEESPCF